MGVNTRIVSTQLLAGLAAVTPPGGTVTPQVAAVVLVDGSGNLLKATDNGDGTATLASTASVAEPAASTVSVDFTVSAVIAATAKDYRGFAVRETAGAAAVVRLWDNASAASGTVVEEITLAANESAREFYGDGGIKTSNGIYAQVVSGTVAGIVRTGP